MSGRVARSTGNGVTTYERQPGGIRRQAWCAPHSVVLDDVGEPYSRVARNRLSVPITTQCGDLNTVTMLIEDFWQCFDRSGGPSACWPWLFGRNDEGYGVMRYHGVVVKVHVVAFETHHRRPVKRGMKLRHSCDNPPCGNPAHLIEGTQGENISDQYFRGRRKRRLGGRRGAQEAGS